MFREEYASLNQDRRLGFSSQQLVANHNWHVAISIVGVRQWQQQYRHCNQSIEWKGIEEMAT